jgi:hypothetical protein
MTEARGDRLVVARFPDAQHAPEGARLTAEARLSDLHFALDPASGRPALWLLGWDARGRPLEPAVAARLLGELSALLNVETMQRSDMPAPAEATAASACTKEPGDMFAARRTGRDNA